MVARRTALGMSQADLVKRLGLHGWKTNTTRISKAENGHGFEFARDPAKVDALRRALEVHPWVIYVGCGMIPPEIYVPAEEARIEIGLALLATALGKIDAPGIPAIAYDAAKRIHLIDIGEGREAERLTDRRALLHGQEMLDSEGARAVDEMAAAIGETHEPRPDTVAEPASEDIW
jgi:transcriptional regulator with XRE-family HTH domain